jgi:hypothetical protein
MSSKLEFCRNFKAFHATLFRLARVVNKLTAGTISAIYASNFSAVASTDSLGLG